MHVLIGVRGRRAVEPAQHQDRGIVGRRHVLAGHRARDLETVVEQGRQRLKAFVVVENLAARTLVQHDPQIASFGAAHPSSSLVMSSAESSRMFNTSTPSLGSGLPAAWNSHFTARG